MKNQRFKNYPKQKLIGRGLLSATFILGGFLFALIIVPSAQLINTVSTKQPVALAYESCKVFTDSTHSDVKECTPNENGTGQCDNHSPSHCTRNCNSSLPGCADAFCDFAINNSNTGRTLSEMRDPLGINLCDTKNTVVGGRQNGVNYNETTYRYTWQCESQTGHTIGCGANKIIDAACGSANGTTGTTAPSGAELCATGIVSSQGVIGIGPWNWTCNGINNGGTANCTKGVTVVPKYSCSGANCISDANGSYTNSWCDSQCSAATQYYTCSGSSCVATSTNTGITDPNCNNSCSAATTKYSCSGAYCVADANGTFTDSTCNNSCSAANTGYYCTSSSACTYGVIPDGKYGFTSLSTCQSYASSLCPTSCTPQNGVCGSANNKATGTAPTSGLCNAGTPSNVTGTGTTWNWSCAAVNSCGTAASCSAPKTCDMTSKTLSLISNPTSGSTIVTGTSVSFTLSQTGLSYKTMDFGDGTVVSTPSVTSTMNHIYTNTTSGNMIYTAKVTANDPSYPSDPNCVTTKTVNIVVSPTPPKSCTINLLANGVKTLLLPADAGGNVKFTGTGTGDINDYVLAYPASIFPDYHNAGTLTATPVTVGPEKLYTKSANPILTGRYYEGAMMKEVAKCDSNSPVATTITVPTTPVMSCKAEPASGKAPSPVHFTVTSRGFDATSVPYQFNMDDPNDWNSWKNNAAGNVWYTFAKDGTYHPAVRHPSYNSNQLVPCYVGSGLTILPPAGGSSHEEAPGN
ncbi:MAG: hypothetical protein PHU86_03680 [Patescibacteria group bacterium]|jgi:hypothetical protein|nr:hypothetical protein [Patescibacteria group bacterium]